MTQTDFINKITENFTFVDRDNITSEEKSAALDELIINCDNETVNPDPQRPITRPA